MSVTIVYTTIFGGSDSVKPAPAGADLCFCFTDDPALSGDAAKGWTPLLGAPCTNPRREAWRLRCVPHRLFGHYDRVVWIDASFTLLDLPKVLQDAGDAPIAALRHHERQSPYREGRRLVKIGQARALDIERQLDVYRTTNFPGEHLSISCLIVRDRSKAVAKFNDTWLEHITRFPGDNTQVSLDYSAWTNGLEIRALTGTRHDNPYARHDERDHRRRRRPYLQTSEVAR